MGQYELPAALARFRNRPRHALNPEGHQGDQRLRQFYRNIRTLMERDDHEMCDIEGYQHLSWTEAIHAALRRDCVDGPESVRTRARKHYYDRRWGRQAYEVTVEQKDDRPDLRTLSPESLRDRANRVIDSIIVTSTPQRRPWNEPEPPEQPEQPAEEPERDDDREEAER